ncbi:hypothetical protein KCU90_g163, partial [Aureobasidium melanogenum]
MWGNVHERLVDRAVRTSPILFSVDQKASGCTGCIHPLTSSCRFSAVSNRASRRTMIIKCHCSTSEMLGQLGLILKRRSMSFRSSNERFYPHPCHMKTWAQSKDQVGMYGCLQPKQKDEEWME